MKMYDNGGIAGQLHMNRQGYQRGERVNPFEDTGNLPGGAYDHGWLTGSLPDIKVIGVEDTPVYAGGTLTEEGIVIPQKTEKEEKIKEYVELPELLKEKKEAGISKQKKDWKRKDYMAWNKYQKLYDDLTSDEKSAIKWEMDQQDFATYESSLPSKIFQKKEPPLGHERMTKKGNEISAGMDILKIASEIKVLYPDRKISTVGELKDFINDTRTIQSIGFGEVVKLTNAIDDASNSMRLTSNTKLGDITHFVDSNMTQLRTEQELGPVKLTSSLTFQDGKLQEGAKTTLNVPIDFSKQLFAKYDDLKFKGNVATDNLENLYADLGVNLNLNDLDLGLTSKYSADDRKDLGLNIGLNKEFESGLGSGVLTPSFSYNILEPDKSKLDIGYQHEFDETIPYVGDGTLKIGGEFDKEGKNLGITFKKKFAEGGRVSFTNGGLANILKV